jgi:hypothetical protein
VTGAGAAAGVEMAAGDGAKGVEGAELVGTRLASLRGPGAVCATGAASWPRSCQKENASVRMNAVRPHKSIRISTSAPRMESDNDSGRS